MKNINFLIFAATLEAACSFNYNEINWRIVGGLTADPGQFPFIISLRNSSNSHACGGSLIENNWVVTAAHCVFNTSSSDFTVVVGTNQLDSKEGVTVTIDQIIVHENYSSEIIINDIALLKLSTPIQETSLIQIIELETNLDDSLRNCTLIGWGRLSYGGTIPNDLQYLPSQTISFESCNEAYPIQRIRNSHICTLTREGQGACNGDSGGPLVSETDGKPKLIGIVSWGIPCAVGQPDVYTRVSSFVDWIKANTGLKI